LRTIFRKDDKEVKFGYVSQSATFKIDNKFPHFDNYDPNKGLYLDELPHYFDLDIPYKSYVIYFSNNIPEKDQQKIREVFSKKYDVPFLSLTLEKEGWEFISSEYFIFGNLQISPFDSRLIGKKLLLKIKNSIQFDRDKIIKSCGYEIKKGLDENEIGNDDIEYDFENFYSNLCDALSLSKFDLSENNFKEFLYRHKGGSIPILLNGNIYGRYGFKISYEARDKKWTEDNWNRDNDETLDGPFEVLESNSIQGHYEGYFNYKNARIRFMEMIDNQESIKDLVRPAYRKLGDEVNGLTMNEFLREHGEHPKELIEISRCLKRLPQILKQ